MATKKSSKGGGKARFPRFSPRNFAAAIAQGKGPGGRSGGLGGTGRALTRSEESASHSSGGSHEAK